MCMPICIRVRFEYQIEISAISAVHRFKIASFKARVKSDVRCIAGKRRKTRGKQAWDELFQPVDGARMRKTGEKRVGGERERIFLGEQMGRGRKTPQFPAEWTLHCFDVGSVFSGFLQGKRVGQLHLTNMARLGNKTEKS
jgi:hypothetical protein